MEAKQFHNSERCFRRYEKVIAEIVRRYPRPVRFRSHRKSTTDAARLTDAIRSYRKNNWTSDCIDRHRFMEEIHGHVDVQPNEDCVVIGPRRPQEIDVIEVSGHSQIAGSVERPTQEQIDLAIAVIEQGIVQMPVMLEQLTPDQMTYVEDEVSQCFNVATREQGPTSLLLI